MSDAHLDDLHKQRAEQAARIMDSVNELVGVIVHDVPAFVLREVRRAFIAAMAFSEGLDEDAVKTLKARAGAFGEEISASLAKALEQDALWLDVEGGEMGGKTLEANLVVWRTLQGVAETTSGLLREVGFPEPEDGFGVVYKTPTWFIERRYAPGLIDKYWTQLALLRHLDQEIDQHTKVLRRVTLESRWDAQ